MIDLYDLNSVIYMCYTQPIFDLKVSELFCHFAFDYLWVLLYYEFNFYLFSEALMQIANIVI